MPLTAGLISEAAKKIPNVAQMLGGAAQMIFSGKKKALKNLEQQTNNSPMYQGSKSINDYYGQALSRYQENPYQSQQYQVASQNAQRGTATGLNALQDRRSGVAGVSRMIGIQDQSLANAGVNAEQQRNQRFGQLGDATSQKNADDLRMFQTNVQSPYDRRLNLANMKAQGAANTFNAGMTNLFNGASNASTSLGSPSNGSKEMPQTGSSMRGMESTISSPRNKISINAPTNLSKTSAMNLKPMPIGIGI